MASLLSYIPVIGHLVLGTVAPSKAIVIPSVEIHSVDTEPDRRARCLKHLIKANHINHSIIYNNLHFDNHTPHILCSAYLLGAGEDQLRAIYEKQAAQLEPWTPSPAEIVEDDWRDFLGDKRYQRAYVDFFEDAFANWNIVNCEWRKQVERYLFSGEKPLVNGLIGGLGHPLIHLGYAYEMNNKDIASEALGLAATQYNYLHRYLDDPAYTKPAPFTSTSPHELLGRLAADKRFDDLFAGPGFANIDPLFEEHEALVMEYWNAWDVGENPLAQFHASQEVAVALLVETVRPESHAYNFFVVHLLTTSHAIRILLPLIPPEFHVSLVRQWWLLTLAVYIAELRPELHPEYVDPSTLGGKDWPYVENRALNSAWSKDSHYVKAIRAVKEAAKVWGDDNSWYLCSAVTFVDNFRGWSFT